MEDQSYIKLFRSMLDWDWWDDLNVRSLWITILLMANWKDKKWRGIVIKRGSFYTSLDHLSQKAGLSVQQTRTALDKLKKTGEITTQSTNNGTLITVENWGRFQGSEDLSTSESTNEQQTTNKRVTNEQQQLKKERIDKKEKKHIDAIRAEFEKLWAEYPKKEGKQKAFDYYKKARKDDATTYEGVLQGIRDYSKYIEAEGREMRYVKNGSTFFSQRAWEDEYDIVSALKKNKQGASSGNAFYDMWLEMGGDND